MVYVLSGFEWFMFWMGLSGQTKFEWFMFWVGLNGWTKFQWFIFWVHHFSGLCFKWVVSVDYFGAFQAKTWVDLTWSPHSDLSKLNAIFSETIVYVLKIIVSCFLCLVWLQESMAKHKDIFVPLAFKKSLVEVSLH
jgi:hypothetical protein